MEARRKNMQKGETMCERGMDWNAEEGYLSTVLTGTGIVLKATTVPIYRTTSTASALTGTGILLNGSMMHVEAQLQRVGSARRLAVLPLNRRVPVSAERLLEMRCVIFGFLTCNPQQCLSTPGDLHVHIRGRAEQRRRLVREPVQRYLRNGEYRRTLSFCNVLSSVRETRDYGKCARDTASAPSVSRCSRCCQIGLTALGGLEGEWAPDGGDLTPPDGDFCPFEWSLPICKASVYGKGGLGV
ncbi:hypothetical protein PRIPAC_93964 [Pristionchus pacificus]|uniref:Uncharacterized protein n=1 Tax=Pristionchus pacificus TaxID=54126 RepID=A0A2A6CEC1_PRIPA|nr:hypothetical protein PRIPAC_93964 [Pristionchus pacificus]|eukprot:PDM76403.1 hypothetical protein PRIPAC_40007 [Pristionchus pacificus]